MNLKSIWIPAIATVALLTGCSSDDIPGPDAKELYTREFVKKFGPHSLQSDSWNLIRQASVTVSAVNPTDVKVYYETSGRRYLCADYRNVTGLETITVDVPADVNNLIVRSGGETYTAPFGARIDLGASREIWEGEVPTLMGNVEVSRADQETFSVDVIKDFIQKALPEEELNLNRKIDGKKILSNFTFVGTGEPFNIYPLYWNTSSAHALGIYWLKDNKEFASQEGDRLFMHDIFYTRTRELSVSEDYVASGYDEFEYVGYCYDFQSPVGGPCNNPSHYGLPIIAYHEGDPKPDAIAGEYEGQRYHAGWVKQYIEGNEGEWKSADPTTNTPYNIGDVKGIRTDGISVTVPKGLRFGFYLRVGEYGGISSDLDKDVTHHIVFSQAARNMTYGHPDHPEAHDIFNCQDQQRIYNHKWSDVNGQDEIDPKNENVFASYLTLPVDGKNVTYFAFEDWNMQGPDLNDLVFIMDTDGVDNDGESNVTVIDEDEDPEDPTVEEEWSSWLLAAEDLGNGDAMGDWDFNDMVVKISTCVVKDGEADPYTSVTVTPLASGGTIPVYLMYTGELQVAGGNKEEGTYWIGGREFHSWLRPGASFTSPLNVGRGSTVSESHYCKNPASITIPGEFTLTSHTTINGMPITADTKGFWFVADKENTMRWNANDKDYTKIDASTLPHDITKIVAPDVDRKEIAAPQMICVDNDWCWPHEGNPIDEAYTLFLRTTGATWYRGENGHVHDNAGVVLRRDLDCHK